MKMIYKQIVARMLKSAFCFTVLIAVYGPIGAQTVSRQEALEFSEYFLFSRFGMLQEPFTGAAPRAILSIQDIIDYENNSSIAYIVELEPAGFLILSKNRNVHPVIAYSFHYHWNADTSCANILYHIIRRDMTLRYQLLDQLPNQTAVRNNEIWKSPARLEKWAVSAMSFQQWPEPGTTWTGGWIETAWEQHFPYNIFCPIDKSQNFKSLTGCTAAALAQIVNYHQYIGDLSFGENDRYVTNTLNIAIDADSSKNDFPSFNRLNHYLDDVRYKYHTSQLLTSDDIAALSFACGVAVGMDYTASASSAFLTGSILKDKFNYGSASDVYGHDPALYIALSNNMKQGLPAWLNILSADQGSHAVVADGYNTDGYYHLNFGWGGHNPDLITSAWYHLPENMGGGYNQVIFGIVDICPTGSFAVNAVDSLALSALYNSTEGPGWINNDNWMTGPVASWYGVSVLAGSVVGVDLSRNQLTGAIPPEIGKMRNLTSLVLSGNRLTGSIPVETGNMVNLEVLYIDHNQLTGNLPAQIANLTNLKQLKLDHNQLMGNIPYGIDNLTNLKQLTLSNNQLEGSIPREIGNLVDLQILDLGSNQLTGNIPPETANLVKLYILGLYNNRLTGKIPSEINNISNLLVLGLHSNSFTALPDLRALSGSLALLSVQENKLTFEDLEPNMGIQSIRSFTYAPQDSVHISGKSRVGRGQPFTLSVRAGGRFNRYQWYKDGVKINKADRKDYYVSHAKETDEGIYHCEVTNILAKDLTLFSKMKSVVIHGSADGPWIGIYGNNMYINNGLCDPAAENGTDFGGALSDSGSITRHYRIHNSGSSQLLIETPVSAAGEHADDFIVFKQPDNEVAPGAYTDFSVCFTPSGAGIRSAAVTVINNDPEENPYTFAVQGTGMDDVNELFPKRPELYQNYPNPFNHETRIDFSMPEPGRADLEIYDMNGRKVRMLYGGFLAAGRHEFVWHGDDDRGRTAASGVYLYVLRSKGQTYRNKCVFMK